MAVGDLMRCGGCWAWRLPRSLPFSACVLEENARLHHSLSAEASTAHTPVEQEAHVEAAPLQGPEEEVIKKPHQVFLDIFSLDGSKGNSMRISSDTTAANVFEAVGAELGVQRTQLALFWDTAQILDSAARPFIDLQEDLVILTAVLKPAPAALDFHFDCINVLSWEKQLEEQEDMCTIVVHVGSCHRMNLQYWHLLSQLIIKYGAIIVGLSVRQLKGYLHPDAVRALARCLPTGLQSLDISSVLPGSRGLAILAAGLPPDLQYLDLSDCVDDGVAFGTELLLVLQGLKLLRRLSATGNWQRAESSIQQVKAAAPVECELILS